jgi:hypothetical protein
MAEIAINKVGKGGRGRGEGSREFKHKNSGVISINYALHTDSMQTQGTAFAQKF